MWFDEAKLRMSESVAWDDDGMASRRRVGDGRMHVVCDFTLRNRVFDVLEKCVMFCLSYELLDGGMVKEDMDVGNETEGIKFKNLKRKNTRVTISSKTGCDIDNDFVFLIQVRVWIHDVSVRDCAVV